VQRRQPAVSCRRYPRISSRWNDPIRYTVVGLESPKKLLKAEPIHLAAKEQSHVKTFQAIQCDRLWATTDADRIVCLSHDTLVNCCYDGVAINYGEREGIVFDQATFRVG
jgi:hypothetical protein